MDGLINKIMVKAKGILDCDICRVYLVNDELLSDNMISHVCTYIETILFILLNIYV